MKIGYPGNMFEIPHPSSGMGFSNNSDTETLELDTGGRFVVDKPTTYKSFNMSWRSTTPKLQPLIDIYNKRYGNDPFYVQDMNGGEGNILPARWAYPRQLAAIHGAIGNATFSPNFASFRSDRFASSRPSVKVPTFVGKPMYLAVFSFTGNPFTHPPVQYRLWTPSGTVTSWRTAGYTRDNNAPTTVLTREESQYYEFVEIRINLHSANIAIEHMDLSTSDYRSYEQRYRSAEGVGGLKFTNTLDGDLTMLRAQRIGLSVDLTEVQ